MRSIVAALLLALALIRPAVAQDNEAANRLFVEAVQAWTGALAKARSAVVFSGCPARPVRACVAPVVLRVARATENTLSRAIAPSDLGKVLSDIEVLNEALSTAREGNPFPHPLSIGRVVEAQAEAGFIAEALLNARSIDDAVWKSSAIAAIAQSHVDEDTFLEALGIAWRIEGAEDLALALTTLGKMRSETEIVVEAPGNARGIEDLDARDSTPASIASDQAGLGDFVAALALSSEIVGSEGRVRVFSAVSRAQARAGPVDAAPRTLPEIDNPDARAPSLAALAEAQAKAGHVATAMDTARGIANASWRALALAAVGSSMNDSMLLVEAIETANRIPEGDQYAMSPVGIVALLPE